MKAVRATTRVAFDVMRGYELLTLPPSFSVDVLIYWARLPHLHQIEAQRPSIIGAIIAVVNVWRPLLTMQAHPMMWTELLCDCTKLKSTNISHPEL